MRCAALLLACAAALAPATAAAEPGIDARTILPLTATDAAADLAAAGDVNGDGIGDLAFGPIPERAEGRRCEPLREDVDAQDARNFQDAAQVVFGRSDLAPPLDLDATGADGLRIRCFGSPHLEDRGRGGRSTYGLTTGGAVAGVGDVNGDGLADVAVGSVSAGPRGRPGGGSVHVVFGAREGGEVDARSLGARGVRIDGPERVSGLGDEIVPLGDVDGDGRANLALPYEVGVAAPDGRRLDRERRRIAIVYGGLRGGEQIDLAAPGDAATVLVADNGDFDPEAPLGLAGADVDGDGVAEVAVYVTPAPDAGLRARHRVLALSVRRRGATIDMRRARPVMTLRSGVETAIGSPLVSAGDVDGDRRADLAVGGVAGLRDAVFVVPSRPGATIDVSRAAPGVRTLLVPTGDGLDFITSVAPLGDVDGDGRPDLLVGRPQVSPDCRTGAGAAWVVPGAPGGGATPVAAAPGAWRVDGMRPSAALGGRLATGDVTGDGLPELVLPSLRTETGPLEVRLLAVRRPDAPAAPLTTLQDCFEVRIITPTLRGLRRGHVSVRVRSNQGAGERQRIAVRVSVAGLPRRPETRAVAVRLRRSLIRAGISRGELRGSGPLDARVDVRLTRRARAELRRARYAYLIVEVEQAQPDGYTFQDELEVAR